MTDTKKITKYDIAGFIAAYGLFLVNAMDRGKDITDASRRQKRFVAYVKLFNGREVGEYVEKELLQDERVRHIVEIIDGIMERKDES